MNELKMQLRGFALILFGMVFVFPTSGGAWTWSYGVRIAAVGAIIVLLPWGLFSRLFHLIRRKICTRTPDAGSASEDSAINTPDSN